jgi:hypothetical protein
MSLTELWLKSRNQLDEKQVHQIIAFAGDGKLRDGNAASQEFRDFLSHVPTNLLRRYIDQCLNDSFTDSGFVLQDIVNQIGRRLGFIVSDGRYRGLAGQEGYDGIWKFPDDHTVIIEVKTTDTYQIDLDKIAKYRRDLINQERASEDSSSILVVIGRQNKDTSGLEAQIRGSRHAWNIRLLSVDALLRLLTLKESVEDPRIIRRISAILIPREFTKLDEIIDIVFSTAEDVKKEETEEAEVDTENGDEGTTVKPVSFYDACIERIERQLKKVLVRQSRTTYSSPDEILRITCAISKQYERGSQSGFWFAFHPFQKEFLEQTKELSFVTFGCGSEQIVLIIPFDDFKNWLEQMNTTDSEGRFYWHVSIVKDGENLTLYRKKGAARIDLTKYLVTADKGT